MAKSPKRRVIKSPAATELLDGHDRAHCDAFEHHSTVTQNEPLLWVLKKQAEVSMGKSICFDSYINYSDVRPSPIVKRESYLDKTVKARLVKGRITPDEHYPLKTFINN